MRPKLGGSSRLWGAVAVVAGFVLGFLLRDTFVARGAAQATGKPIGGVSAVGRYQLISHSGSSIERVYVIDTQTGQCWEEDPTGGPWQEDSPTIAKAK